MLKLLPINAPPDCSQAQANPGFLWPANHKLTRVTLLNVSDPDGDAPALTITGIFQDEPVGNKPDAVIRGASADVRAERAGQGNGRVYHLFFSAADAQGASCSGEIVLGVVPHDQSGNLEPLDEGPLYDSTQAE
jgi:hypothetical protein